MTWGMAIAETVFGYYLFCLTNTMDIFPYLHISLTRTTCQTDIPAVGHMPDKSRMIPAKVFRATYRAFGHNAGPSFACHYFSTIFQFFDLPSHVTRNHVYSVNLSAMALSLTLASSCMNPLVSWYSIAPSEVMT